MANLSGFVKRLRDIMRNDAGINGDAQRIEQIAWMLFLKVYDAKEQDWEFDDEDYTSIIPEECRWANWAHDDRSGTAMTGERLLDFVNNTLFPTLKKLPVDASTPIKKAIVQTTFADANNYMKDGVLLRQVLNVIDELDLSDYEESHAFGEIYETILKELQSAGSAGEFYTPRAVTEFMAQMIKPQIGEKMADFACGTGGFLTSWLKELEKEVKTTEDREAFGRSIYGIEKKQFPYMLCITNMLLHDLDVPQVFHDNSLLRDVLDYTADDQFDVILMNPPYGGSEKAEVKNHFPADLASSETADLFMSVIMYRLKENGRAAVILPDGFLFGTDNAKINIKKKLLSEFNLHTIVRMPGSVFSPYTSITTNILFFDRTGPTKETWFYRLDMPEGYKHFSKTKPMKLEHFAPVIEWWNQRCEVIDENSDAIATSFKARRYSVDEIAANGYDLDLCGFPVRQKTILSPEETIQNYIEQKRSLEEKLRIATDNLKEYLAGNHSVGLENIKTLSDQIGVIDAAFPSDMKAALLLAAMQGKLTERLPNDGDADALVKEINRKREEGIRNKTIRKTKGESSFTDDDLPYEVPETWRWMRFGQLVSNHDGERRPVSKDKRINEKGTYPYYGATGAIDVVDSYLFDGDYLMIGEDGGNFFVDRDNSFIARGKFWANNHVHVVQPIIIDIVFLKRFLDSCNLPLMGLINGIAVPKLNQENMNSIMVPIPPMAEQKRIVARLEELLPLCERLK